MTPIDADSEETWPEEIRAALSGRQVQIQSFQAERARIDRAAQEDVMLRIHRPANQYQQAWDEVLEISEKATAGKRLVGFHCTRITETERADVEANGLCKLTSALFERRLQCVLSEGHISDDVAAALRFRNQVDEPNRTGVICFCFNRDLLSHESGVERLFRSWGGEALYNSHEDDKATGPALAAIGLPCIVVASLPINEVWAYHTVGQRLVNLWCAKRDITTGEDGNFEGRIKTDLSGDNILRVIGYDDPEFLRLTEHSKWRDPLR